MGTLLQFIVFYKMIREILILIQSFYYCQSNIIFPSRGSRGVVCGPSDCNLSCSSPDQCLQDSNIQCVISPCCPQWSCQKPQCPPQRPEFNKDWSVTMANRLAVEKNCQ